MKIVEFHNDFHWFQAACHLLITRPIPGKEHEDLIAMGLIDVDALVRGLAARALKGESLTIREGRFGSASGHVKADRNNYRLVHRPAGRTTTHTLVIHKSAADDIIEGGSHRTLLIPGGGDIALLFARRFANDFDLPFVPEWKEALWEACTDLELVQPLNVWTDPDWETWRDIQAYQLSPEFNEERAKSILSELLASRRIALPEGITEAPPLSQGLASNDEDGEEGRLITYLQTYAPHLAAAIEDSAQPAHDLDRPIHPAIATMARVPFPAQSHVAQAAINGFQHQKGVIVAADMGCGKSLVALAVSNALAAVSKQRGGFTTLMLVPSITVPKWIHGEIKKTLPNAIITQFSKWKDVVRWREKRRQHPIAHGQMEFVILARDTAKLGMPKAPALIYKERHVYASERPAKYNEDGNLVIQPGTPDTARVVKLEDVWICPECYAVQTKTDEESIKAAKEAAGDNDFELFMELKLGFDDLAEHHRNYEAGTVGQHVVSRSQYRFHDNVRDYHCSACNTNLSRFVDPEREKVSGLSRRRLQPAWFIQRYLKGYFDVLIIDELHEYRNTSGQGQAMGAVVTACKKVLGLTGTLSTGSASSLFYLLWRLVPGDMLRMGFDHKSLGKWVHLYGAVEQRGRYTEDDVRSAGGHTGRKLVMNPPKEIPGLSPKLFANFLSSQCLFLELGDLGLPLVEIDEKPVFVDMDDEHRFQYVLFHNKFNDLAKSKSAYIAGNTHAYAKFIPSVVNAANQPHVPQHILVGDEAIIWQPTHDEGELSAKERRVLADIQEDVANGRRCVVYVRYSGKEYEQDTRLHEIFLKAGLRSRLLKATVPAEDRVAWLQKAVDDDIEVVVCQTRLVEIGLDLLDFPSINFWQFTDQINSLRQAAKRAWRIGQTKACTVRFYVTNASYELAQFNRMMKRRITAMLLEGRLDKSSLASFGQKDELSASTFNIAACLGDVNDLTNRWKSVADKDIPQGVLLLQEDQFAVEIGAAMKRLAAETRRLAGVPEPKEMISALVGRFEQNTVELSLFDELTLNEEVEVSSLADVDVSETVELITVGNWRSGQMGMVTKAKRAQKAPQNDDQLLLFCL